MQRNSQFKYRPAKGCPLCGRPVATEFSPFCSRGCKDRDLLNWLGDAYRLPERDEQDESASGLDSNPQA